MFSSFKFQSLHILRGTCNLKDHGGEWPLIEDTKMCYYLISELEACLKEVTRQDM